MVPSSQRIPKSWVLWAVYTEVTSATTGVKRGSSLTVQHTSTILGKNGSITSPDETAVAVVVGSR